MEPQRSALRLQLRQAPYPLRLTKHLANLTASQCTATDTNCPRRQRTEHSMAACLAAHSLGRRHELVGRAGHCCLGPAKREIVRRLESLYFVQLAEQSIRRLLTEHGAQLADRMAVRVSELGLQSRRALRHSLWRSLSFHNDPVAVPCRAT